ncbi:MAG: ECF transporter S component [Bacteroides sp.]|nr:ECF transporter S component [Bacteroides sp.]
MSDNKNAAAAAAPVKKLNVKTLTGLGLLTAIIIVLQFVCLALRPTGFFNITLCLVPIVVGAALYGIKAGAWLGFVFGIIVTITDSAAFMVVNAPATIAVCILKGTLSGLAAGAVYKLLEKKNRYAAAIAAGIACPVVNTGVFALGCLAFFMPTIAEWGLAAGIENAVFFLFAGIITTNFFIELAVNLLLSSAVVTIIKLGRKNTVAAIIKLDKKDK